MIIDYIHWLHVIVATILYILQCIPKSQSLKEFLLFIKYSHLTK